MASSTCTTTTCTTCAVAAGASPSAATNVFAAVDVAFVGVVWVGPVAVDVSVGACCGFDKVDEAVEDADFAFEFGAVDEGLVGDLDEVEACELESDNRDFDWMGQCLLVLCSNHIAIGSPAVVLQTKECSFPRALMERAYSFV